MNPASDLLAAVGCLPGGFGIFPQPRSIILVCMYQISTRKYQGRNLVQIMTNEEHRYYNCQLLHGVYHVIYNLHLETKLCKVQRVQIK